MVAGLIIGLFGERTRNRSLEAISEAPRTKSGAAPAVSQSLASDTANTTEGTML